MKIIITGHTSGIGKELYTHFNNDPNNVVIGLSRTTGYDLTTDIEKVIKVVSGCDLFINNTCAGECQIELVSQLHSQVGKMIVMGGTLGDYHHVFNTDYSSIKNRLKEKCRDISLLPDVSLLYLNISKLEDDEGMERLIPFDRIVNFIDFWLKDSMISSVTFDLKLTDKNIKLISEKTNTTYFKNIITNE